MNYRFFGNKAPLSTPQNLPLPGRETEMRQGRSGGWAFDPGNWAMLRRCLLLGTAQATYYAGKTELTEDFVQTLHLALQADPQRVAQEICYASDGRAINNSAPIFGLVLLSMAPQPEAKRAFRDIFFEVVRTGSHFYEWLTYTKQLRGMGRVIKDMGRAWLSRPDVTALAYQLLKYQERHGLSHRDTLRLLHLKPPTTDHDLLFNWAVKGWEVLPEQAPSPALAQIWWWEWLKRNPDQTLTAIRQGRLTHEMAAPIGQMNQDAWQALFEEMPIGALLRNLGSLTQLGVLRADAGANLERVEALLNRREAIRRGRIHPIDVLKALKTYGSGGSLGRSQKTWTPVPRVMDILETALELAFETQAPTQKIFLHAVDISGSMSGAAVPNLNLTCCEIAAVMALATAKAEKNYVIRGFSTEFRDLGITHRDSFSSALTKSSNQNFGGTDATVAYDWATRHHFMADLVCFWTDSESWAGRTHPSVALQKYRAKVNPKAKAVYITLMPYQLTLVDPQDNLSWDLGGFDPGTPRVLQMIASGEI